MTAPSCTKLTEQLAPYLRAALLAVAVAAVPSVPALATDAARVQVQKPDGSLQCQPGTGLSPEQMGEELTNAGIEVYSARNMSSGMMVPAVCDAPTGRINLFEIDAAALDAAQELGFVPPVQPPRP